jgi:asparagine synthase (glutamine-hydrolysing)
MARTSAAPVKTFSIGFEQQAFDELKYARQVAELYGTEHHEFVVRPDAAALLPKIVRHYGEPFGDSSAVPSFQLAEMTRRHVTVALNGDGGDESFGGYMRYVANRVAHHLDVVPVSVRRGLATLAARSPQRGEATSVANRARRLGHALALEPAARHRQYMSWFDDEQRASIYTPELREQLDGDEARAVLEEPWSRATGQDVLDVMLEVDVGTYLPGDLLTKIDIASMAYSLEARSPLLDHELMQFAASIPATLKVRGTEKKWILREALREWLPPEILDRRKQGFELPIDHWLGGELGGFARDVLLDRQTIERGYFQPEAVRGLLQRQPSGTYAEAQRVWSLLMLELWHREFVDGDQKFAAAAGVGYETDEHG